MAFKMRAPEKVKTQIELNGGTILDIDVNVGKIALHFNEEYNKVIRCQKLESTHENMETLGKTVIGFMTFIIGEENANALLEAFEDNWIELLSQFIPFVEIEVSPAIKNYLEHKTKVAAEQYEAQQRNRFGVK